MKFYPRISIDVKDVHSIVWSGRHGGYMLSSDGKVIGNAVISPEQWIQINNNDFSCLESLGFNDVLKYDVSGYIDTNMTGIYAVRIEITERINDNQLPFGVFVLKMTNDGLVFVPYGSTQKNANIVDNKNLKEMVKEFLTNGTEGRKNKKGMLLFGPPGNGKTTEVMSLFSLCEEMKVRIYLVDSGMNLNWIHGAKKLLQKDKNIFIMEEITERVNGREIEHLLTFLDGESSWDNTITIATTNYPEDLPANLVDRPGRFDTFIEYGNPSKDDIIKLGEKFGFTADESATVSGRGYSFDYVSFIMSVSKNTGNSLIQTVTEETDKRKKISATFKGRMGIG